VLPKGFVQVRYYGRFSDRPHALLAQVRQQLLRTEPHTAAARDAAVPPPRPAPEALRCCPVCGQPMQHTVLRPACSRGPPARMTGWAGPPQCGPAERWCAGPACVARTDSGATDRQAAANHATVAGHDPLPGYANVLWPLATRLAA